MHYYLIINEGLSNGLIQSQVLKPIQYNSLEKEIGIISIEKPGKKVSLIPGLYFKIIPLGIPYRLFLFNNLGLIFIPFLAALYALVLAFITKKEDIIIARSYFPAIVLLYLKKFRGNRFKFDPRSLFILESNTKGLIKKDSLLYKKWVDWEKEILANAELTSVVAEKQAEYYLEAVGRNIPVVYIPCYASDVEIKPINRNSFLPFKREDIVLAYYGSLDKGWNNIDVYYSFFQQAINLGYKVCIVSQNYNDLLKDKRFQRDEIYIVNTDLHLNYSEFLQSCDYGVVIIPKVPDWETRLSVKFVEYLNNGLGVLVGEYVGEAVRLSKEYFQDFTSIVNDNQFHFCLKRLTLNDKNNLNMKAGKIFGMQNFNLLLNERPFFKS